MGFFEKLKRMFGFEEEIKEISDMEEESEISITDEVDGMKLIVIEPKSFDEAQRVIDDLKSGRPVVINFEETDRELARRFIDFVTGGVYAMDGTTEKIANYVVLFAPPGVEVSKESKKFWKKKIEEKEEI
ncbi:MAG: cell division protein SepF [Caldiserica bacterium]|nr:MAG: cell division protein SepF [Caldisericota bacterium]